MNHCSKSGKDKRFCFSPVAGPNSVDTGVISPGVNRQGWFLHTVPRLRTSAAMPLLSYVFTVCRGTTLALGLSHLLTQFLKQGAVPHWTHQQNINRHLLVVKTHFSTHFVVCPMKRGFLTYCHARGKAT
jgi:hypothetical protein